MKIRAGFVKQKVAGSYVAVATGKAAESFHGMIKLNETASFLWDRLVVGATEDDLVTALLAEFDVEEPTARDHVATFTHTLSEAGILE